MADYIIPRTDAASTPITVIDDQIGQTIPPVDIDLVGQNATNYGTAVATTQVHLMENFAASTAPPKPLTGQLWYDNGINVLQVNIGGDGPLAIWEPVATGSGGETNIGITLPQTPPQNSASVYAGKNGVALQFKSIVGGDNIAVTPDAGGEFITVSYVGSSNSGETNTAVNVGTGSAVYKQKVGVQFQFRTITAGSGITVSTVGDNVQIDNTGGGSSGGEANTASNISGLSFSPAPARYGVFAQKNGVDLQFKSFRAGTNISMSETAEEITISSTASGGGGLNAVVEDPSPELGGDLETNGHLIKLEDTDSLSTQPAYIEANSGYGRMLAIGGKWDSGSTYSRYVNIVTQTGSGGTKNFIFGTDGNLSVVNGTVPNSGNDLITKDYADAQYGGTTGYSRATLYSASGGSSGDNITISFSSVNSYKQVMVECISRQGGTWYAVEMFDRASIRFGQSYSKAMVASLGDNNGRVNYKWNSATSITVLSSTDQVNGGGIARVIGINF